MAGMLPGVECARRRRFHQSSGSSSDSPAISSFGSGTRRPSFCLYASSHEYSHHTMKRCTSGSQAYQDEKLGGVAREAKERLDERLRAQRKSDSKRSSSNNGVREGAWLRIVEGKNTVGLELQTEVFGLKKKSGSKRFGWVKFGWKASSQDECAICLDQFNVGETLVHLPCAHRFHSTCLAPWLDTNAQCPCCRMGIFT